MRRLVFLFFLAFSSLSCSLVKEEVKTEDVDKYATLFFERLAAANYDKIYKDSAESFRKGNPQSEVFTTLKQMSDLGKPGSPNRIMMTLDKEDGKRVALPTYHVYFDNKRVTVNFKFIDEDGEWKLGAYEVKQRVG